MNWAKTIKPKSDQLNADDLIGNKTKIITITKAVVSDNKDQPASIFFEGDNGKPYKPCLTMRKLIAHCWGVNEADFTGRLLELYRDDSVTWGGEAVGGIRIKAMSHINERKRLSVAASNKKKITVTAEPLIIAPTQHAAPASSDAKVMEHEQKAEAKTQELLSVVGMISTQENMDSFLSLNKVALDWLAKNYATKRELISSALQSKENEIKSQSERCDATNDMFEEEIA